jgi:uncharacterized protein YneF (UPF0154 family)
VILYILYGVFAFIAGLLLGALLVERHLRKDDGELS